MITTVVTENTRPRTAALRLGDWRGVVAAWLGTRCVLVVATAIAARTLEPAALAHEWLHWDALWYLRIAAQGYATRPAAAFFPLYPLLIRLVTPLTLGHPLAAALLLANGAALLAALGVARLAGDLRPGQPAMAVLATTMLLASPLAFFLAAPYADALLAASVVWALAAARERRWWLAALCAFASALTHITGVLLVLPLLWEFVAAAAQHASNDSRATVVKRLVAGGLAVGAPVVALDAFAAYLRLRFGDGLLYLRAEHVYYLRQTMPPWQSIAMAAGWLAQAVGQSGVLSFPVARQLMDDLPVAAALVGALALWHHAARERGSEGAGPASLFSLLVVLAAISAPVVAPGYYIPWAAAGRYMLAAVAVPLALAAWAERNRWRALALILGGLALQLILLAFFFRPDAPFGLV